MTAPTLLPSGSIRLAGRMPFRRGFASQILCRLHSPEGELGSARVVTLASGELVE